MDTTPPQLTRRAALVPALITEQAESQRQALAEALQQQARVRLEPLEDLSRGTSRRLIDDIHSSNAQAVPHFLVTAAAARSLVG